MPQPPEPTRLMNCDEPIHCVGSAEALWVLTKYVIAASDGALPLCITAYINITGANTCPLEHV